MYYKTDWEQAKTRLNSFWNRQETDRCCLGILAPRKTSKIPSFPQLTHGPWLGGLEKLSDNDTDSIERWWTDPELNYQRAKKWFENTYFGGEAVPATYINWGASAACAFWNSKPVFNKNSVWFPKVINDWNTWQWQFDDHYLKIINSILDIFIENNNEAYFLGVPEIGNAADNLSLLRGMDQLAMDILMEPDAVKKAIGIMSDKWIEIEELFFNKCKKMNDQGGVLAWLNFWAPGKHDQIANDFSSILSTDMYKDFFFPELKKMGAYLDYTTFHLDGPECINNHLDAILGIEQINCIQFTPGAGSPPTSTPSYIQKFRKIQESGKNLYLLAQIEEVEILVKELSPVGLFINTYSDSEEEADRLIQSVTKWTKNKQ